MAALPSVVLGFLAGLWLAPVIERVVPGLFLAPAVLLVAILVALLAWQLVPLWIRARLRSGTEILLLVPVVVAGLWAAFALGGVVEATLLGGSYREWLQSALGLTYDQRNSLVVGIRDGLRGDPDHLHHRRGRPLQRAGAPARGLAGARRQPLADGGAHRPAHGQPRDLLGAS